MKSYLLNEKYLKKLDGVINQDDSINCINNHAGTLYGTVRPFKIVQPCTIYYEDRAEGEGSRAYTFGNFLNTESQKLDHLEEQVVKFYIVNSYEDLEHNYDGDIGNYVRWAVYRGVWEFVLRKKTICLNDAELIRYVVNEEDYQDENAVNNAKYWIDREIFDKNAQFETQKIPVKLCVASDWTEYVVGIECNNNELKVLYRWEKLILKKEYRFVEEITKKQDQLIPTRCTIDTD